MRVSTKTNKQTFCYSLPNYYFIDLRIKHWNNIHCHVGSFGPTWSGYHPRSISPPLLQPHRNSDLLSNSIFEVHLLLNFVPSRLLWLQITFFVSDHQLKSFEIILESFKVLYVCSSSWLLTDKSHDLSQAEKEITVSKAEKTQKITIMFNQNGNFWPFCVKIIVILWIC